MSTETPNNQESLREQLASIEHQRWADWQQYIHSLMRPHDNPMRDELTIDASWIERWERQINTPYADLSEEEKQSDREQVDRYWPLIESAIQEARKHEAADIHKAGFDLLMKKGASAVVAGGTDLDKLLNQIEAKYGKDLIHYVYGEHNQPKPSLTNSEPTNKTLSKEKK